MIPVESIEPVVTATVNSLQAVPIESIAYVPKDVFIQYTYIQMAIDGVVAGIIGFVLGWKIHEKRMQKKADAQKDKQKGRIPVTFRKEPPSGGAGGPV